MSTSSFDPYAPPESPIGESAGVTPSVPDWSPWLTIWFWPRATVRRRLDSNPTRHVLVLGALSGIGWCLWNAHASHRGDKLSTPRLFLEVFGGGAIFGLFLLYLLGFAIRWTGKWIGGKGSQTEIRAALAWTGLIIIPVIPILLLAYLIEGDELFTKFQPDHLSHPMIFIRLGLSLLEIVLMFWYALTWVKCVAEAHRFSWVRAIGAFVLFVLVWEGLFLIIVGVVYLASLVFGFPFK